MRRRHLSATASPLGARRRLAVTLELPEAGWVFASPAAAPSRVSSFALESRGLPAWRGSEVGWGEGPWAGGTLESPLLRDDYLMRWGRTA